MLKHVNKFIKRLTYMVRTKKLTSTLSPEDHDLIEQIRFNNLTYLSNTKLASISNSCRAIEESNLPGIFIEAGCALGGSAILIARIKKSERIFSIYDLFGMIPPPTIDDTQDVHERYREIVKGKSNGIGGETYYGYQDNLYEIVQSNLKQFGISCENHSISMIKGLVQDTMNINTPVAFAHIDVDWYEAVMTCLKRIFPNLVVGGCIILDDYHDWGGCKKATDEYLHSIAGQFILNDSAGSMKITKIKSTVSLDMDH